MTDGNDSGDDKNKNDGITKEQFEALQAQLEKNSAELKALKSAKAEIVADRDALKSQLKELEDAKATEGATEEKLKELLEAEKIKVKELQAQSLNDKKRFRLEVKAQEMGLRDMSFLNSHLDYDKVSLDKEGNLVGGVEALESMKEKHGFLFETKKPPVDTDLNPNPDSHKTPDIKFGAVEGKSPVEMAKIQRERAERYKKEQEGKLPGLGNNAKMGPDPDKAQSA